MKSLLHRILATATLGLMAATCHGESQVVNVDMGSGRSPVYVGQGAAGIGGSVWNPVKAALPAPLLDSMSNATPVSVIAISPGFHFWQRDPDWPLIVEGAEDLMRDYWAISRSRTFMIEVGGIPLDWTFDLFVYAAGDTNNQGTQVTIGGTAQSTTGILEQGKSLTKGLHYVVFTGLKAESGSLLIEATHNPEQPGGYGAINGFQMIVHDPADVAAVPPPPAATTDVGDSRMSSGLWVTLGFGLAVIFVVVLSRVMKFSPSKGEAEASQPVLIEEGDQPNQEPLIETTGLDLQDSDEERTLRARAEAAERRANAAETVVREGLMPEMKKVLKHKVVSHLVTEREELLRAQQQAAMDIEAFERRLTQMHAPVRERLDAYEQRISDLEKELNQRGAENRELLRATIALARQKVEEERSRSRIDFN